VEALNTLMDAIPSDVIKRVARIAVSGTSGTVLLCDGRTGLPSEGRGDPRMYDYSVAKQAPGDSGSRALALIAASAPTDSVVRSPTSSLAKLLAWDAEAPLQPHERLAHQADYIAAQLCEGATFTSDWHNALKLGFDVAALCYPAWLAEGGIGERVAAALPAVVRPGAEIGTVSQRVAERWGFRPDCVITGGSTDSISAFLAAGASEVGDAVSSLGSTLAIKMLSDTPVEDARRGIYSHRLGDMWLAGGASNVGCAVLREQGFSADELSRLSEAIDPAQPPEQAGYYPLPNAVVGERFPLADDTRTALLEPVPADRGAFLHSILHAIARVEAEGYSALAELGASPLRRVLTCGGGARNDQWTALRQVMLGVPTLRAGQTDAAVGVALLAARGG